MWKERKMDWPVDPPTAHALLHSLACAAAATGNLLVYLSKEGRMDCLADMGTT